MAHTQLMKNLNRECNVMAMELLERSRMEMLAHGKEEHSGGDRSIMGVLRECIISGVSQRND